MKRIRNFLKNQLSITLTNLVLQVHFKICYQILIVSLILKSRQRQKKLKLKNKKPKAQFNLKLIDLKSQYLK